MHPCASPLCLHIAAALVGCGPGNPLGRKALSGVVTLDGAPLDSGTIEFHPLEGGIQSGGLIHAWHYSIAADKGATPGKYRVQIADTYESPPLPPGHMPGDDPPSAFKSRVPPEWNNKSKQEIEVKKEGPFKFNFDFATKKKRDRSPPVSCLLPRSHA
jgi:hypothetical protein